jgi:hypothetical protein
MFAKNDERAHASAAGGWDQPRQWGSRTRVLLGIIIALLVVALIVGIIVYVGENADKIPPEVEVPQAAAVLLG